MSSNEILAGRRTWHAAGALGLVLIALVCFVACFTTGEVSAATVAYLGGSVLVVLTAWAMVHRRRPRLLLLVWPVLDFAGMLGASQLAPQAGRLCLSAIIFGFLFVGFTQRRGTSVALWPLAAVPWWLLSDLPVEQTVVRLTLASVTWMAIAELTAWLIARLSRALHQVELQAVTDPLTGLTNRRGWDRRLDDLMTGRQPLSVLLLDLDHFKAFNDEHGHLAGDDLLVAFADRLRHLVEQDEVVARWGGEEFVVALPGRDAATARAVGEGLVGAVPSGQTCSVGLVTHRPGESGDMLMNRVDDALYRAKESGRARVVAV